MFDKLIYNKFKDYEIDIDHNNKVFSIFYECISILLENNIDFTVGGSISLILNTNTIYRTIGDIDFVLKHPFSSVEFYLFKKNGFLEPNFRRIGKHLLLKDNVMIEYNLIILPYSTIIENCKKFNYKNNQININSIKDVLYGKTLILDTERKKKHLDDIEFYSKYL